MNAKKIEEKPAKAYNEIMTNIEKIGESSTIKKRNPIEGIKLMSK